MTVFTRKRVKRESSMPRFIVEGRCAHFRMTALIVEDGTRPLRHRGLNDEGPRACFGAAVLADEAGDPRVLGNPLEREGSEAGRSGDSLYR